MTNLISKKIRGFRDVLSKECEKFLYVENNFHNLCPLFNINQVKIPTLESINLFMRSIGETSDIVTKEMYSFNDKNNDVVCMIPEGTASCMRLAFENNLIYDRGIKKNRLYYLSNMFRHERPQKGRYRQFTQIGVEFMGDDSVLDDIDLLSMSKTFFDNLNLHDVYLMINTLGSTDDRNKYSQKLINYFEKYNDSFTDAQKLTLKKNPLRLLDSKDDKLTGILELAPKINNYLSKKSLNKFDDIINNLDNLGINYTIDEKLVRGLDYYNDMVFEWKTNKLGTQDAVCAGGRYDGLAKIIGGQDIPAVGFAIGIDRIVDLIDSSKNEIIVGLSVITNDQQDYQKILSILRKQEENIRLIQMDQDKSLSKQIKSAVKSNCDILVIVGSDEMSNNTFTLKYLKKNLDDVLIKHSDFSKYIKEY